jgi:transcriptional regulator
MDEEQKKMICMLAEHGAILTSIVERLDRHDAYVAAIEERLSKEIKSAQKCVCERIDKIDDRLRNVEKSSAVYGSTAGAIMSTLITVGINLLIGKSH